MKSRRSIGKRPRRSGARGNRASGPPEPKEFGPQRLQKVLAAAGLGSRRECETLITAGRVQVDGQTVTELGTKVEPHEQEVRVDGQTLPRARKVYYLVHKPPGVLSTNRDPSGRPRVVDLVPPGPERVYAVGRLDQSSEGLMLVTNDGELANQVTHPRYGVRKTYQVLVAGTPAPEALDRLLGGIHLAEGVAKVDRLEVKAEHGKSTMLEIVLSEGRNREIRRLLARVGHKVLRLRRIAVGGLKLKGLKSGEFRRLTHDEVERLRAAVLEPDPSRAKRTKGSRSKLAEHRGRRGSHAGANSSKRLSGFGGKSRRRGGRDAGARSLPQGPALGAIVDDA